VYLRGYPYDIYTQIGLVTLSGLAVKNAILIVEYARQRHEHGKTVEEAALEAAQLRLRPILMSSFAFILGVVAASRRALGTAVFGGMNAATLLAVFLVPVLFVIVERVARGKRAPAEPALSEEPLAELHR
jgi:HAE1 family hydrophobic/amphiphilic exporter-1